MSSNGCNGEEVICQCLQVSEQTIRSSIESGQLKTIEQVTRACEAGGGCQSCHILLQLFIDEYQGKKVPMEDLVHDFAFKVKRRGILSRFFSKAAS